MKRKSNVFVVLMMFGIMSCTLKAEREDTKVQVPVNKYSALVVKKQNVELQTQFPTKLQGEVDIEIKPRINGTITKVFVDEGALVKKGDPLFKIDAPSSVQELETAEANYKTAQLNVDRMRPLADKEIISEVQLQSYENALSSAKAALAKAKASQSWSTVTSPISGTVGDINFRLGSLVTSNSVLTHVANTNKVIAYFSMNEKDILSFLT